MNTQLKELQRLLAEIDSLVGSVEVSGLIRDARACAEIARNRTAKAIKIIAELDAQQSPAVPELAEGEPKDALALAQRNCRFLAEFHNTPLENFMEDLAPAFAALAQPSPTLEAADDRETPKIVGWMDDTGRPVKIGPSGRYHQPLMTITQHDRMALERWQYFRRKMRQMRDLMRGMRDRLNAAQSRVAELEASSKRSDCDQRENDAMLEVVTAELNTLRAARGAVDLSAVWRYGFKGTDFGMIDDGPYVLMEQVQKALAAATAQGGE